MSQRYNQIQPSTMRAGASMSQKRQGRMGRMGKGGV